MDPSTLNDDLAEYENGFVVIPGFLSPSEVEDLKRATADVVAEHCQNAPISIFGDQSRDDYFADSGDKIRGFYEEGVVDADGKLTIETPKDGLNKVAHALHKFNPTFRSVTFSKKVKQVLEKVTEMKDPLVNQSMVIFKHPKVGGVVIPHQDATYLFTEPTQGTLIGFWIALDEATNDNGCLHFAKGSHKAKVYQRYIRNPDKSSKTLFVYTGEPVPPVKKEDWIAAPCKPGDLVLIDGKVIHQSEPNRSDKPRMAYTFHVIDGAANWSTDNWLQSTSANTFERFKDVTV